MTCGLQPVDATNQLSGMAGKAVGKKINDISRQIDFPLLGQSRNDTPSHFVIRGHDSCRHSPAQSACQLTSKTGETFNITITGKYYLLTSPVKRIHRTLQLKQGRSLSNEELQIVDG
jgi:hypothetical protein